MKSWKFFVLNSWVNLQNEVDLLSKIQHPNVISLLGCSSNEDSRFIVYELMQNGSLETQLHGKNIVSELPSFAFKTNISDCNRYGKISHTIVMSTFIALSLQFESVPVV